MNLAITLACIVTGILITALFSTWVFTMSAERKLRGIDQ